MKKATSLLFCGLLSAFATPQSSMLFSPSFEHIDVEAGLSNYNVSSISQDSLGYLWIGTSRGLNRYDGQDFKIYLFDPNAPEEGLPHDMIMRVQCARNYVFVRTIRGVVALNQKTDKWIKIADNRSLTDFLAYNNNVYFVFNGKLHYYDFSEDKLAIVGGLERFASLFFLESNDDLLWFANTETMFCCDKNMKLRHKIKIGKMILSQDAYVFNNHLLLKRNQGISIHEIVDKAVKREPLKELKELTPSPIVHLTAVNRQAIAISTMGAGIFFYRTQ